MLGLEVKAGLSEDLPFVDEEGLGRAVDKKVVLCKSPPMIGILQFLQNFYLKIYLNLTEALIERA